MQYEVDKWDIDENSDIFKPLNKKNKKDIEGTREYCDEHEFLYGNHTCEPIWEEKTGNLKKYEILVHTTKTKKRKFNKRYFREMSMFFRLKNNQQQQ